MFVVGLDRRIVAVNEAGAVLAGRSADVLTGERITTLLDDPAEAPNDAVWRAQVLRGESFGRRRIRRPDGSTRVVDFAMRASRAGGTVLVLGVCVRERVERVARSGRTPAPLTTREQEIVRLIALGEVTAEICAGLHIAPDTVRAHVRNAMAKTGARTRAQLIAIALTEGLLDKLRPREPDLLSARAEARSVGAQRGAPRLRRERQCSGPIRPDPRPIGYKRGHGRREAIRAVDGRLRGRGRRRGLRRGVELARHRSRRSSSSRSAARRSSSSATGPPPNRTGATSAGSRPPPIASATSPRARPGQPCVLRRTGAEIK